MTFGDELHRFTNVCQVLAGSACDGKRPRSEIAVSMVAALPRVQSPADFLMLRSIVTDFVLRALDGDPAAREHAMAELVRAHPPRDELGHTLIRCLSTNRRRTPTGRLKSLQQLRADRAMAVIVRRCGEPSLTLRMVAEEVQVSGEYVSKLLRARYGNRLSDSRPAGAHASRLRTPRPLAPEREGNRRSGRLPIDEPVRQGVPSGTGPHTRRIPPAASPVKRSAGHARTGMSQLCLTSSSKPVAALRKCFKFQKLFDEAERRRAGGNVVLRHVPGTDACCL